MSVDFYFDGKKVKNLFRGATPETQEKMYEYIGSEILRKSEPYLPFSEGGLTRSGRYESSDHSVVWGNSEAPYAHYLHEGKLYVDPITGKGAFYNDEYGFWSRPGVTKIPTDVDLHFHGGGLRGSHWVERMLQNGGMREIEDGFVEEFADKIFGGGA